MSADTRKRELEALEGRAARRNHDSGTVEPGPAMTVDQAKALLQREGLSKKEKRSGKEKSKRREKEKRSGKGARGKKEKRGKKKRRRRDGSDSEGSSSDDSSDSGSSDVHRRGNEKPRRWAAASFAKARDDGEKNAEWGSPPGPDARVEPASEDDYYLKNREFSVWLKHERSVYFTDLLAADARAAFKDFVKAWNARALPATFYKEGGVSASGRR